LLTNAPHIKISGTGSYVPTRVVTNKELEKNSPTNALWVEENLGIVERHVAEEGQFTSDLAFEASLKAIDASGITVDDIGLIIVATASPDRKAPSTACILQNKLKQTNNCPAFDVSAVCSGFIYALTLASQAIELGSINYALVVGADTFSKITDWTRRDCVFFGDGAGAVVLSRRTEPGLFKSKLQADGNGMDSFTVYPYDPYFTMSGKDVYNTGTEVLSTAIKSVLKEANLSTEQISCVIPHQPSIRVLKRTSELLQVDFDKIKRNMNLYANTAGATVPLLLDEVVRRKEISTNDIVVFAAVGSGWTWGAAVYKW
jgi:3-oxoacyl-[acyl-carrier-protein] synthase-3